jgi:DNA-directed RNA polymerase specialized sigma24 family protein
LENDGGQVTRLLKAMHAGDAQAAESLLPLVYSELHRLAKGYMRRERPDHTLQATALINEAYLRLVGEDIDWNSRAHFIGLAANVMRRVLVDYARGRNAEQSPGGRVAVFWRPVGRADWSLAGDRSAFGQAGLGPGKNLAVSRASAGTKISFRNCGPFLGAVPP